MAVCSHCGEPVVEGASFCANCGAPLKEEPAQTYQNDIFEPVPQEEPGIFDQPQPSAYVPQPVEPIPTGGLIAWGIFVLLFCTIPGVVALINTRKINRATSYEEQQHALDVTKKWLIAGTILAVLNMILQVYSRMQ